ncbi:hypothetical protein D5018_17615 [Parashewanella curva]|uniref:Uncharacterized protein n=1 Tax=Parashewanella curva TaxID=2338552 RepID=A0A3L8PSH3_9GAMM|nr:hypothetical protein [Parashewanella curva]RLV58367.1 hypothetical protein D5018_17615 [Parashewanella curva]
MSSYAFDLSNHQHLAMRRILAEIYSKFWSAIRHGDFSLANRYAGMTSALLRVCLLVLNDIDLYEICSQLSDVLHEQLGYHQHRQAA